MEIISGLLRLCHISDAVQRISSYMTECYLLQYSARPLIHAVKRGIELSKQKRISQIAQRR